MAHFPHGDFSLMWLRRTALLGIDSVDFHDGRLKPDHSSELMTFIIQENQFRLRKAGRPVRVNTFGTPGSIIY